MKEKNTEKQPNRQHDLDVLSLAKAVLETEASAVLALVPRLDARFINACDTLLACQGRVVVIGMGKSGHIGRKIAATLASTGSPAFFVHPGEANHGDMGMLKREDVVLLLSQSGTTTELVNLIPFLKRLGTPIIALTGNTQSLLALSADIHLDVSVDKEACPLGLAPTASTTATLAMGDALAVALLEQRGFTAEDFALSHPGGALGRQLLLRVDDIMHSGKDLPYVQEQASIGDALLEMSAKGLGMTAVVDSAQQVLGVFTDGDLRRALAKPIAINDTPVTAHMTHPCTTLRTQTLAVDALKLMEQKKINGLLVVDEDDKLIGAFNMHNLLRAQVI